MRKCDIILLTALLLLTPAALCLDYMLWKSAGEVAATARRYAPISSKESYEYSSPYGGEYDVQNCLLGCTAVSNNCRQLFFTAVHPRRQF
jgi:hypothetical protein